MTQLDMQTLVNVLQKTIEQESAGGMDPGGSITPYGYNSEMTWTNWTDSVDKGHFQNVKVKESSLTPFTAPMYGCSGIFGLCGPDEIIGMTMRDDPLVEWLGMFPDNICEKFIKGWVYTDIQGTAAGTAVGTVYGEACDNPPIAEKGICEFFIGDYGTLRACGETVKVNDIGLRKCDKQPTYTVPVEGVGPIRIDNDLDLETITGAQVVKHELSRLIITGDKNVVGQFDGLSQLVKTGYISIEGNACTVMDSVVVDWANDDLDGTVNGHGSIVTKVRDIWRRIRWRIQQASLGAPAEGDVVLVMPSWLSWEFLDEWAFWAFKEQTGAGNQVVYRDAYEMREMREKFNGGLFGGGYITIDGFNIHIIAHDWMPIDQDAPSFCSDIYLLTRRIGTRRVLQGQYVPSDAGANAVAKYAGYRYFQVESLQGGRVLRWMKYDNACVSPCLLMRPRLYIETPWAQAVIQNVCVTVQFDPQSLDPQSNYFIEENLVAAGSRTQYFYESGEGWFHPPTDER